LAGLLGNDAVVPMVRGRATRLLYDQGRIARERLLVDASRALSRAVPPADAAMWTQGLLAGSGLLLVHERELLAVLDTWLAELAAADFAAMLPLLRRSFSAFEAAERRAMGELLRNLRGGGPSSRSAEVDDIDPARAELVMPVLAHILGIGRT
jgi:hypothetical protein